MYLKSIEIHGFKSFANKIVFQFHNGITGIVGPNGSGKSNVADAVRWVLGEQRVKQLRGSSMQDVIFSGTEIRRPMSYAYVAITLDNSDRQLAIDYEEVTVARRIYRSGESEYLLNNTPCRLKDVNELFYDTGIGKEGYSIIGQGQIDKILSGKPEERRELFDEAAGIVKFKRRKAAAQKKLEDEQQNLVRVKDILSELEKQVGPLEKQSEKARVYLKKKEELKGLDVNVFLLENDRLKGELASVSDKYEIAAEDLEQTTRQYEHIKEEYENIQAQIEELDREIDSERSFLSERGLRHGRLEGEINVLKEQINSALGNENHLSSRRETLEKEAGRRQADLDEILEEKVQTDSRLLQAQAERNQAAGFLEEIQSRISECSMEMENGKNTIISELNRRAAVRSRMGRLDSMQEQVQIRRAELNSRLLQIRSSEAEQEESIRDLETEFERINGTITALQASREQTEKELSVLHDTLSGRDAELGKAQTEYHQYKSRLDALVNLTERYEGYGGSVRRVMEQKEHTRGIIGVVADLLRVDKKYEVAIETALGGSIQNIVTDTEETAKKMIAFLKAEKAGRATFLPLVSLKSGQEFRQKEALREPGVLGLADSLVDIDEKYRDVAVSLLGRILVVDQVDHAVSIARKYRYSLRMVTLEGELFTPGGAISGGAYKNNSNLLGRRREIAGLEKQVKECLNRTESLQEEIETTKENRNRLRRELEQLKERLQQEFIRQNTARMNVAAAREKKEAAEQGYEDLRREQEEIDARTEEILNGREEIKRDLAASLQLEKDVNLRIETARRKQEQLKEQESRQAALVSQRQLETQKIRQQQEFQQTNLDRLNGEKKRCQEELEEILEAIRENGLQIEEKEDRIRRMRKEMDTSLSEHTEGEKKLKEDQQRREQLAGRQKNFFADRESLAQKQSGLDKEVYRLNAQREKLEEAIESHISYMWDEYEITLSDARLLRNETMKDLAAMKKEIASLKEQIRKLGDVNVNAIEDYRVLLERYTFLKGQHDDLVQAQETLMGIIRELDEAMRRQFKEKFATIAAEFDKVFRELFGGGRGTLELMEDEDILEAGIKIIAQPPGKKLQNMMQLSGGEKALTAISLLFAIQNLKPSPFCLLDEIEAALDDSNVGRFANYLHKLTKYTQFIVITHRRGTMEKVDRLYGITMQEKGVSTLVSVSLIDKELEN